MQTLKVIASTLDKLGRRLVKAYRYGVIDVQTPLQANPPGLDSSPIKDMVAVYSKTDEDGTRAIVGYFNKNQVAAEGESRLYSIDANGNLKTYIWLKNTGTMELGGNADNAIRYSPLSSELDNFKTQIQDELVKIATGITTAGGAYTPGTLTIDISASKITTIKTP